MGDEDFDDILDSAIKGTRPSSGVRSGFADREPRKQSGLVKGVARAAAQGATFGFADEAEAGLRSLIGGGDYRTVKQGINAERSQFADEHPALSMGTELAASVVTPGAVGKLLTKAPAAVRGLSALAGNPIVNKVTGGPIRQAALGGALGSAGASDEGVDGADMLSGALLGGGLGAAARAVGVGARGGKAVLDRGRALMQGGDDAVARGQALVRDAADAEGGLPAVYRRLTETQRVEPDVMLGEVMGNRGQTLMRGTTLSGEAAERVGSNVAQRAAREPFAVVQDIANASRQGQVAVRKVVDDAAEKASKAARPLYDAAYQNGEKILEKLPAERQTLLRSLMLDEDVADAFKVGQKLEGQRALLRGGTDRLYPPLTRDAVLDEGVSLQHLDAIKRGLDAKIGPLLRAGDRETAAPLIAIKNEIKQMGTEAVPEYGAALKLWSGKMDFEEAVEGAKSMLKMRAVGLSDAVGQMSKAEREGFRIGAVQELMAQAEASGGRSAAAKLLDKDMQEKLRLVFDPKEASELIETLTTRSTLRRGTSRLAGSNTANKAADRMQVEDALATGDDAADGFLDRLASGSGVLGAAVGTAKRAAGGALTRARTGAVGKSADEVARLMSASGPDAEAALQDLLRREPEIARQLGSAVDNLLPSFSRPRPGYAYGTGNLVRMAKDRNN